MAKAAVLLPRQGMQQMAADLIAQYPNLSPFCIEYTHTDAACQRAIRLQNDGCELILARGLQAAPVDELAHQMPNIVGMKDTVSGMDHTRELIKVVKSQIPQFEIYSGFDDNFAHPGGCRPGRVCAYHDRRRTFIKRSLCHEYHPACPS